MARKKKKPLTAAELLVYLMILEDSGCDLNRITVNFRKDMDSDVHCASNVGEDLFDARTNSVLESIVLVENDN